MKHIAILGAGFAGLAAAYQLTKRGYDVTVFEKESIPGGLATGYKEKGWEWSLEKHYHHFFTNDFELINLAKELNISSSLIFPKSLTSLYFNGKIFPFNTPLQILNFSPLNFLNRLRLGMITAFLKTLPQSLGIKLEKYTAFEAANKLFGQEVFKIIWKPLLDKKFGDYADQVNFSWLWARIKKRTLQLGYVSGGFQTISNKLAQRIQEQGGKILFNTEIKQVKQVKNKWEIIISERVADAEVGKFSRNCPWAPQKIFYQRGDRQDPRVNNNFDVVISTLPTPVFTKIITGLPQNYIKQLSSIPHLHALDLVLETIKPFLNDTYWLNVNDDKFPFLCVVQHTNFIDKKHYGNNHLLYISNYLSIDHPYFKKTARELFNIYKPYLQKINPDFNLSYYSNRHSGEPPVGGDSRIKEDGFWTSQNDDGNIISCKLFVGPFAQPVFLTNYSKIRPWGQILPNLYFANLDSVYPWDRGTNYALEIGRKIAELISQK